MKEILFDTIQKKIPKKVYHYTTWEAFQKIIENDSLRISDRDYMNDISDRTFIYKQLGKIIEGNFEQIFKSLIEYNKKNGKTLDRSIITKNLMNKLNERYTGQYVFSTSKLDDSINQWNCYGKDNGCCLEFITSDLSGFFSEFEATSQKEILSFEPLPVIYANNIDKYENIVINEFKNIEELLYHKKLGEKEIYNRNKNVSEIIIWLLICLKQKGWACEEEVRFLFRACKPDDFFLRNGLFVPCLKIKVEDKKLPISKVIISPMNKDVRTEGTLKMFLDKHGYSNVKIERSTVEVR